ncbi:MAG: FecR family protein, partial [Candidatus Omnitrophota bacterium]
VEKGMQLNIGDTVRTARHSKVDIALDQNKKNTIQLAERTLAVLNSATADTIDRLDLSRGRVYSNMEGIKAGFDFEVTTPSAVAGVRGSSYMVYAERDQDEIAAYKDTVFIKAFDVDKNQLLEMMLPEGFKTFIERFAEPSALLQVSLREFSRFDNIRNDLVSRSEGREPVRQERERRGPFEKEQSVIEKLTKQAADQGAVLDQVTDTKDITEDRNTEELVDERTDGCSESEIEIY